MALVPLRKGPAASSAQLQRSAQNAMTMAKYSYHLSGWGYEPLFFAGVAEGFFPYSPEGYEAAYAYFHGTDGDKVAGYPNVPELDEFRLWLMSYIGVSQEIANNRSANRANTAAYSPDSGDIPFQIVIGPGASGAHLTQLRRRVRDKMATGIYAPAITQDIVKRTPADELVTIWNGQQIPKSWIISDTTNSYGRRTISYRAGGNGPTITGSWGGSEPIEESQILDLIVKENPTGDVRDNRLYPVAWRVRTMNRLKGTVLKETNVTRWNGGLYPWDISLLQDKTGGKLGITYVYESRVQGPLADQFRAAPAGNTPPPAIFGLGEHGEPWPPVTGGGTPATHEPDPPPGVGPNDLKLPQPSQPAGGGGGVVQVTPGAQPAPGPVSGSQPTDTPATDTTDTATALGVPMWLLGIGIAAGLLALMSMMRKG